MSQALPSAASSHECLFSGISAHAMLPAHRLWGSLQVPQAAATQASVCAWGGQESAHVTVALFPFHAK